MEARSFAKAADGANAALKEFPADEELVKLQKLAEQGLERIKESRRLLEEGQRAFAEKNLPQAAELLRIGLKLDPRFSGLRDALVSVLTEWARVQLQTDWRNAEPLYEEARGLDPSHPAVRALRSTIDEAKRQAAVTRCLSDARVLAASGNAGAAFEIVRTARADYPNDPRLEQYEANLLRESPELRGLAEVKVAPEGAGRVAARAPDESAANVPLERAPGFAGKPPSDPGIEQTISEVQSGSRPGLKQDFAKQAQLEATKVFPLGDEEGKKDNALVVRFRAARQAVLDFVRTLPRWVPPQPAYLKWGGLAVVVVLIAVVAYVAGHRREPQAQRQVEPRKALTQVQIATDPPDATITVDSRPVQAGSVSVPAGGTVTIEVSRLGYKTKSLQLTAEARQEIKLDPEPLRLSIQTPEKDGVVELDDKKIGDLANGEMENDGLLPDGNEHKLSVLARGKRLFTVEFQALPGSAPHLSPLSANDFLAVASLGANAMLYGGSMVRNVRVDDRKIADAQNSGVALPPLTDQVHELKYGVGGEEGSVSLGISPAPVLIIRSVNPMEQFLITSNVDTATLTVDGEVVRHQLHGWRVSKPPGVHHFALAADGYKPQTWTMTMQPHQTIRKEVALTAVPAKPTTSPVVIANGTPGAEVFLDGKKAGELDSAGNGQFSLATAGGRHQLVLQKPGYESHTIDFPAPQPPAPYRVPNEDVKLTQFGMLQFTGAAKDLPIKYHRAGEPVQSINTPAQLVVPAGKYEILVDAPGYTPYKTEVTVKSGQPTPVNLNAVAPIPAVDDPSQVTVENEWFKAKDPGKFIYLKPGAVNVNLVFSKPKSGFFAKSKILWVAVSSDGQAEVQYELEDQKLSRRLVLEGKGADQKSGKVNVVSVTQSVSLSVHVQVDHSHIRLTNDKGEVLDDYSVAGHDLSKGKIGIKTSSLFAVWSNR